MGAQLKYFEYYLPQKYSLKNYFKKKNWDYKKISNTTGIKFIRKAKSNVSSFDLALKASKKILKKFPKNKIDGIIFISQSPETNLPSTACKLQYFLNLKKDLISFDINQGCSGFVYGLSVANALIQNKEAKNILIICSDTYTKYIKPDDRTNYSIFSDGASAVIISDSQKSEFVDFQYHTAGEGYADLCVDKNSTLFMNGKKVLMFTMNEVPKIIQKILKKNKINLKNIDYFIFHQASKVVLDNLSRKIGIDRKKFYFDISKIGNTVSSTVPIAFFQLIKNKKIKRGDIILIAGYGVGLSIAVSILKF